jgi:tetratricopeptide (TPR) repeat protein
MQPKGTRLIWILPLMGFMAMAQGDQSLNSERAIVATIQQIERSQGPYASELVDRLTSLGALYYRKRQYTLAIDTYRRAQEVLHRHEGVYAMAQLDLVDWLALNYLMVGDVAAADTQQQFRYQVLLHNYDEMDVRLLPTLNRLGDWYYALGQLWDSEYFYEQALAIVSYQRLSPLERTKPLQGLEAILAVSVNSPVTPRTANLGMRLYYNVQQQLLSDNAQALTAVNYQLATWFQINGELTAANEMLVLASRLGRPAEQAPPSLN